MPSTNRPPRPLRAFTLIELICVCAVIGILLDTLAPAIGARILRAQVAAETASLQNLAAAAQASFESTDLEGTNLAALPGTLPGGVDSTQFSPSLDPAYVPASTASCDWFAKLARQRGDSPLVGVAPTRALQPRVADVLFNAENNARCLLVGPSDEPTQQRFILLSLVAAPGQLAMPPLPDAANPQDPADLAVFNDLWNTDWTSPSAVLPPSWIAALSPAQLQAWQGSAGSGGRLWQLCVQRFSCAKCSLTINNTHPSDNAYVYYNFNGNTSGNSATAAANSGTCVVAGILSGRMIQAYRGAAPPPTAQLFSQFDLRDDSEITLQD